MHISEFFTFPFLSVQGRNYFFLLYPWENWSSNDPTEFIRSNTASSRARNWAQMYLTTKFVLHYAKLLILVFYPCVTNYHKLGSLKQYTLSPSFCGSGAWAQLSWILCSGSCQAASKIMARQCSHLQGWLGNSIKATRSTSHFRWDPDPLLRDLAWLSYAHLE